MKRLTVNDYNFNNKTVLLRVDYNVPIVKKEITDNYKIKVTLPLIRFLLQKKCKIVLMSHLGRPKGEYNSKYTLRPVFEELKRLLPKENITFLKNCLGVKKTIDQGRSKEIFFLENLRFYAEEENNDPIFAHSLATFGDVYINNAFGVCHRKHASVEAITKFVPSISGPLVEKEIYYLNKVLKNHLYNVWIFGGAKLKKIDLIKKALKKADKVLIGGALAFSFLRAKNVPVGQSLIDTESILLAQKILKDKNAHKIVLPIDFRVSEKFYQFAPVKIVEEIKDNQIALDIGPKTAKLFNYHLFHAKTVIWNGPLGYSEWSRYSLGTKEVARFLKKIKGIKVCGGAETCQAIHNYGLENNFTFLSTGGGASLSFLSGNKMPALDALIKK
jgi:3-phosphoglycerate kinase